MITQFLIDLLSNMIIGLLDLLGDVNIVIPEGAFNSVKDVCITAGYVLPMGLLSPILVISGSLAIFNIIWRLIIRIRDLIFG